MGCNFRTTERSAGTHTQELTISNDAGNILWSVEESCDSTTLKLTPGTYLLNFQVSSSGVNESVTMITDYSAVAFQPLLLDENGAAVNRATLPIGTDLSTMTLENPTYKKNPKKFGCKVNLLDIRSMFGCWCNCLYAHEKHGKRLRVGNEQVLWL